MTASPGTSRRLRFLFVMQYPGYLRYFDSTVRQLAERGHHVDVMFDKPHKQAEGIEALAGASPGIEVLDRSPRRGGVWGVVGKAVRGTIDYVRYLHPSFADALYLRGRMRPALPWIFAWLGRWQTASEWTTRSLVRLFMTCERAIPSDPGIEQFMRSRNSDLVIVTPLVTDRSSQVDLIKSAKALGLPTALCVASWDHLTTKGLVRLIPDLVAVWNEEQRAEAIQFHFVPADRILVSGAQPFDRWFARAPSPREDFCRRVGLPHERPFVLFVGSTASISAPEAEVRFVRIWTETLRRDPAFASVALLIRPHPYNASHWGAVDFSNVADVAVYPRQANPVNERDRQDYFDSLYHSSAVVGVNTTAMIEAAIVGRTVHAIVGDDFRDAQGGTLHFRYLLPENGGFLRIARDLTEHVRQLSETLRSPEVGRGECERFVKTFIRPHGIERPATPILVEALEQLARSGPRTPETIPVWLYPVRFMMWLAGFVAVNGSRDRLRRAVWDWRRAPTRRRKKPRREPTRPARADSARHETPGEADVRRRRAG